MHGKSAIITGATSGMGKAKAFDPDAIVQQTASNTLMKRLGNPEDFVSLAFFLVFDEASWIMDSAYTIDGGI